MTIARWFMPLLVAVGSTVALASEEKLDPAKLPDKVTIEPGKKLVVRFEAKGDKLVGPKVVEKATDDPPTPSFELGKLGDGLALTTKNPYPKNLKFRALARLKGRKDFFETSIIPVRSKLFGIELWQDPIVELVLFDFELTAG